MSQRYLGVLAGAAFALSAAASAAAFAQAAPNAPPQPRAERHERSMVLRHEDDQPDRAEHLRAILQLKPAQEAALTAYLAAMHPLRDREKMRRMHSQPRPKTTPDKLARMEARMAEHEAAMTSQIAATRRFYDQLEPSQKRAFDELPLMMGRPMGAMPRMHGTKIIHHPHPSAPPMALEPPATPRS